jgi:phosphoribosyl 1,2-cyclic phosphodiesterase
VALRFCSLGSGSEGNALVVESVIEGVITRVLVDCGFGKKELESRLSAIGLNTSDVCAVLVTHEHSDHIGGAFRAASSYGWSVHLTYGTLVAARGRNQGARQKHDLKVIEPHQSFRIGSLEIEPVSVPHDAREPVQFVISDKDHRLGVLTDIGHPTAHVIRSFNRLDGFLIECNHDSRMLADSDYPAMLKRRISGPYGHLDNGQASEIMSKIDLSRLKLIVAGHLSKSNNTPMLALEAILSGLKANLSNTSQLTDDSSLAQLEAFKVLVASQNEGICWQTI